jgi:DtxR family manganese transport transcriptional regulator
MTRATRRIDPARYDHVRETHKHEMAEDYVELIADLIDSSGEARLVDIAGRLGVSHPTANKVIGRLQREGLVTSQPYRAIFLTDEGQALAADTKRRHRIVYDFLVSIGVSAATAELDAEGIEHHVSEETLSALERMTRGR